MPNLGGAVQHFWPKSNQIGHLACLVQHGHSCSEDGIREVESRLKTLHSPSVVLVFPPPVNTSNVALPLLQIIFHFTGINMQRKH